MKICTVIFILTLVVSLPVSGQVQLDSRQQKQLNDAEYYMNQAANDFQELTQLTRGLEAAPDISVISLNKLKEEMAKFGYTRQKLQNVESRLQNLPADLQIVGEMAAAAAGFRQRLDADEQVFTAIQAKLESIQDINNWPDFKTDLETLEGMTSMFSTSSMLTQYPDRAVKALEQWEQIQTFFHGLQKYQPLINQQSAEGRQIQQAVNNHSLKITAFQEEARKFIDAVPGEIDRYLKLADEMAEDAVKNTKPRLFQGGVAQQLKLADDRVRVLGALTQKYDPTLYNTQKKKLDDAKSKLAHMQASLKDAIIASNQAPQDNYDGNDKAQLLELVRKTWGEEYPDDEILGIRFVMKEWDRTTAWRWASVAEKWYKEDYSELHPYVVVKTSDTIATTYFAYMVKDHMKGDKVKLTLDDKSSTSPEWQMLMTNWK